MIRIYIFITQSGSRLDLSGNLNLYQGPRAGLNPNVSPYCTKIELYLRAANIPHSIHRSNPKKSPTGKIPYISIGDRVIADSGFIIDFCEHYFNKSLDMDLSKEQKAQGRLIRRCLEESTYFYITYERWGIKKNWSAFRKNLKKTLSWPKSWIIPYFYRRRILKAAFYQGASRLALSDMREVALADFKSLEILIGEKKFLFGDKISSFDCTIFAFLAALSTTNFSFPAADFCKNSKILQDYFWRILKAYFAELLPKEV